MLHSTSSNFELQRKELETTRDLASDRVSQLTAEVEILSQAYDTAREPALKQAERVGETQAAYRPVQTELKKVIAALRDADQYLEQVEYDKKRGARFDKDAFDRVDAEAQRWRPIKRELERLDEHFDAQLADRQSRHWELNEEMERAEIRLQSGRHELRIAERKYQMSQFEVRQFDKSRSELINLLAPQP